MMKRQIVAMGGGGFSMEPDNPRLDDFVLSLATKRHPKICFVPTASGDSETYRQRFLDAFPEQRAAASVLSLFRREHADLRKVGLEQDIIYVGGGSTPNMLAIWRVHGFDKILREAYRAGVILAGLSAGALCWFEGGITDSFGPSMSPLQDGLGLLTGSFCPHYGNEDERGPVLHDALQSNRLPTCLAATDSAAIHFVDEQLCEVVTSTPEAAVFRVARGEDHAVETPLGARFLGQLLG